LNLATAFVSVSNSWFRIRSVDTSTPTTIGNLQQRCRAIAARRVEDDPVVRRLQYAKQVTWLSLLTAAFLIYHLTGRMQDALYLVR
jgi:hypothetical protein